MCQARDLSDQTASTFVIEWVLCATPENTQLNSYVQSQTCWSYRIVWKCCNLTVWKCYTQVQEVSGKRSALFFSKLYLYLYLHHYHDYFEYMTCSHKPGNKSQVQVSHFTCTVARVNMSKEKIKYFKEPHLVMLEHIIRPCQNRDVLDTLMKVLLEVIITDHWLECGKAYVTSAMSDEHYLCLIRDLWKLIFFKMADICLPNHHPWWKIAIMYLICKQFEKTMLMLLIVL